jgi:integrating conjugative element membrane protein (TIGR03747 family)
MQSETHTRPAPKPQRGIFGLLLHLIVQIGIIGIAAWITLCIGFGVYSALAGMDKTEQRINSLVHVNTALLKTHYDYGAFQEGETWLVDKLVTQTHAQQGMRCVQERINEVRNGLHKPGSRIKESIDSIRQGVVHPLIVICCGVTLVIGMRGFIVLLALPMFLILITVGVVDGLVQRDIRKFQCARESTYIFHRIKRSWAGYFFVLLWLYLVCPLALSPLWFLLPMAMGLTVLIQMGVTSFKKYL